MFDAAIMKKKTVKVSVWLVFCFSCLPKRSIHKNRRKKLH